MTASPLNQTNDNALTVIIVSYNSQQVLTECLGTLIDSKAYPVIVIDNASPDGSAEALNKRFPKATLEALPKNIGYGRAANVGLRMVETPYALLLNPDLIAPTDAVEQLLSTARNDPGAAIWGPASERKEFTGEPPQSVEWISGCAMLFDMYKIRQVGLFDENIFLFFEETDLCQRARNEGFGVKLCKDIHFDHLLGQGCSPSPTVEALKAWHYGWSRCYFFDKHGMATGKRSPHRQYRQYLVKSWLAIKTGKRIKYRFQSRGAKAYIRREKAFREDGSPQQPSL